ncbi:MAG: hypothetical protein JWQ69_3012 [Pseudomonas sp.]|nr:hypothetical protein [Pseudomonas sp.]
MWLNTAEQDLRQNLQDLASDMRWSAVELLAIAKRLGESGNEVDAQMALKICQLLETGDGRLTTYADEVKARVINKTLVE